MTNQFPPPSGPTLNPTGLWVSGFLVGLLVGLVPWAISQFLPRGDKAPAQTQSMNVINPTPQQEGFNIPPNQTPPVTATPVPVSTPSGVVSQAPTTIPSQPSTSKPSVTQTTRTNVTVSPRPIPARW